MNRTDLWDIILEHYWSEEPIKLPQKLPPRTPTAPGQRIKLRGRTATGETVHLWNFGKTVAVLVAWDFEAYAIENEKPALIHSVTELETI